MSKKKKAPAPPPAWKGSWDVAFYEAPDGELPGLSWLHSFPVKVQKRMVAIITAVAQRPPPSFPASSNEWQVMHTDARPWWSSRAARSRIGPRWKSGSTPTPAGTGAST